MVGHIQSKAQQKKARKKAPVAGKRTSSKLRKVKAPTELRVKRHKSTSFDDVVGTGRLTGRANSFLKGPGVVGTKVRRKTWWEGKPVQVAEGKWVSRRCSSKLG